MLTLFFDALKSYRLHYRLFFTFFSLSKSPIRYYFFEVSNIDYSLFFYYQFPTLPQYRENGKAYRKFKFNENAC